MEFDFVGDREIEKFFEMSKKILIDAEMYSFHHDGLKLFFILALVNATHDVNKTVNHYIAFNSYGWAIMLDMPDFVEVKYIFVYPEHRRKGFFTCLLTLLKQEKKEIIVCTRESVMLKALVARGFELKGRSVDETELKFILNVNI